VSVFRQSAIIFVLGWLLTPLQFLTSVLVARAVGPEGKGVLLLLSGLTAVVTTLTSLGAVAGAAILYKQKRHTAGEILGTVFVLTAASFLVVSVFYALLSKPFVEIFLGSNESIRVQPIWILLSLAPAIPSALLAVGDVLLIADDAMGFYAVRGTGTALLGLALTWLLAFALDMGITGVLISIPLASLFGAGVIVYWLVRKGAFSTVRFSLKASRDLLRIGLQQYGLGLVSLVAKRFDGFLIARALSVKDAGYYAIAITCQNALVNVPRATMWPLVSSLSENKAQNNDVLARVCRVQCFLLLIVTGVVFLVAPGLVELVFGSAFAPCIGPLRWALCGVFVTPVIISTNAYLTSRGQPGRTIMPAVVATALQIGLNLALVSRWGPAASALALTANNITVAIFQLAILRTDGQASPREMLIPSRADLAAFRGMLSRVHVRSVLTRGRSGAGSGSSTGKKGE
jgi:O-antigen/teichoic acid export membrane protein